MTQQLHARLTRSASTLEPIAPYAAGDDVLPILAATVRDRHHVVEGQFGRREHLAAILTGVMVARIDVGPGERHVVEPALDLDEPEQADHGRELERERDSSYFAVMNRDHLHFS